MSAYSGSKVIALAYKEAHTWDSLQEKKKECIWLLLVGGGRGGWLVGEEKRLCFQ